MRTLVTGGAGFIGSNICRLLRSGGHEVVVLDSLVSGYRRNLDFDPTIGFISADVRDLASVEQACANVDAVFHLAASVGNKRSIDDPFTDAAVNAMGTVNVMEAARRRGIGRVVVSSSAGAFGELKTLPIAEDHPVEPDTPYGASKLFQEKFALSYAKLYGMNVVALRYFNVYGPNQRFDAYGNVIPIFAYRMLRGETVTVFGDGEQTRDFVHVADVADANYLGATVAGASGAFNLGSGSRVTINRLLELMQEVSGIRARIEHAEPRPGDVRHSMADIAKAGTQLGFAPRVELKEGLRDYMAWLRRDLASAGA
jgi:UDP-glucose 4-epimerase